jgi:hypothetical protein
MAVTLILALSIVDLSATSSTMRLNLTGASTDAIIGAVTSTHLLDAVQACTDGEVVKGQYLVPVAASDWTPIAAVANKSIATHMSTKFSTAIPAVKTGFSVPARKDSIADLTTVNQVLTPGVTPFSLLVTALTGAGFSSDGGSLAQSAPSPTGKTLKRGRKHPKK